MTRKKTLNHRELLRLRRQHFRQAALENAEAGSAHETTELGGGEHAHAHGHGHSHAHSGAVLEEKTAALVEAERQVEKLKDQMMRQQAEFENTRRRMQREQQQQADFSNQKLIEGLLPVLDNFDRALANPGESVETLSSGILMVRKQLFDFLTQHGLEKIEALGQPFDPNQHEAVSMASPTDEQQENQVVEVFQDGYQLKNRLIRPAMVKVAK